MKIIFSSFLLKFLIKTFFRPFIGVVCEYSGPGTVPPPCCLFLNGQEISRTTYADLFAVIGTTFGTGDGATTFNLEDRRGRVAVGIDMANANTSAATDNRVTTPIANALTVGGNGGEQEHTLSIGEMPSHSHLVNSAAYASDMVGAMAVDSEPNYTIPSQPQGGSQPHNNMPPFIFKQFIIYTGVYEN